MKKGKQLYEGKAKKIFATDEPGQLWVSYKDDATAFNGVKRGQIAAKGQINNQMSAKLFEYLRQQGIENHFIKLLSDTEQLVESLQILPLEVVVRNVVAGSLSKRVGKAEGYRLSEPILELYYKDDDLGDPLVNECHARVLGWASLGQIRQVQEIALQVNNLLLPLFSKVGIDLIDYKLEFGLKDAKVLLGDEISPDTCRLWDKASGRKLDKDRFRRDLGQVEEAYQEVYRRLLEVL